MLSHLELKHSPFGVRLHMSQRGRSDTDRVFARFNEENWIPKPGFFLAYAAGNGTIPVSQGENSYPKGRLN